VTKSVGEIYKLCHCQTRLLQATWQVEANTYQVSKKQGTQLTAFESGKRSHMSFCDVLFVGHECSGTNMYSYLKTTFTRSNVYQHIPPYYEEPDYKVVHGHDNNRRVIDAGTLPKLVECITNEDFVHNHVYALILTYPVVTDKLTLMLALRSRFNTKIQTPSRYIKETVHKIRLRVVSFIRTWMTICPRDFDAQMLHHVKEIELALFIRNKYYGDDISIKELYLKPIESESPIPPTIQLEFETNTILDYDSIEIARQLTIIQEELLYTIPREELFTWVKEDKKGPSLEKMTEYYNRVKWWVGYEITAVESVQDRVQILEKFVDIGLECLRLLNINMVLAISAGLTSIAVQQLKQTVSEGYTMKREKLLQYLDYNTGTQQLLMLNRYTRTPSIPYIDLFMINLSHIEKSDPTYLNNNGIEMINFYKLRRYSEVIAQIQSRQVGEKYKLQVYPRLKELLQNIPLYSEEQVIKQGSARNRIKGLFE
jgi:hypothetical protein